MAGLKYLVAGMECLADVASKVPDEPCSEHGSRNYPGGLKVE